MAGSELILAIVDVLAHETMLFAAIGFLIGGLDDLLVDILYGIRFVGNRLARRGVAEPVLADLPPPAGRMILFVPVWDEARVIGAMLHTALARFDRADFRIYVGTYPNDSGTQAAVAGAAASDARIRMVVNDRAGPTTKADCLNALWRALLFDEADEGFTARAVILHDAEDVVHRGELAVYAHHLNRADVVQVPVLPLVDPGSRMVSGHYLDEFAEAHAKVLLVRQALGAGLPLAGVGCAIARPVLGHVAEMRGGLPFDETSLTEDYELGLTLAAIGARTAFARVAEAPGGLPVAVRAFFPGRLDAAVRQKARWMTGIALAGWDRVGWGKWHAVGDHWMRMRDRRAMIAVLVLGAAYLALVAWTVSAVLHLLSGVPMPATAPPVQALLWINAALLAWRLTVRALFVGRAYGWREALLSAPRMLVANLIALLAARRALARYIGLLRGRALAWDKTAHHFPDLSASDAGR